MIKITTTFKLTAVAAAMLAAYGSAFAEDEEIRELTQPVSSVSVGVGYQSNDRQQLGMFDGMRDDGLYGLFDADVVKRDEATGTWYVLRASKLGMDSRSLEAEIQQQGNMGGFISYRRIPREHPLTIGTSLGGIGHEVQVVDGTGFRKKELGTYRDLVQGGFNKNLMRGLDLKVGLKHEEKSGDRHWGYRSGNSMYFLTEPIDSVTRQLDLTLEYTTERLQLAGGYSGSWYGNRTDSVTAIRNGAVDAEMSVPADNQAHQFFLNGGYSFTSSTRGTIKLSHSTAMQDESLPNPSPFLGARDSLDGEVVTTLIELGLTSRPTDKLSLMANLRYHDVDDRTSRTGFVDDDEARYYTPYDYTTNSGKLEAAYRLPSRFKLIAGVDIKQQERSVPRTQDERVTPFNKDLDETTYRLQLRRSMSETLNGALTFARSERDGSGREVPHEPANQTVADLITPIHIADRTRDKWRLSLDWAPVDKFGVQFNVEESRDDYDGEDGRPFGLQSGRASLISLDANYQVNDEWQLTGWLSHDETRASQLGESTGQNNQGNATNRVTRDASLKDVGDSVGLGVRGSVGERLKLGADLQWTRNVSSYDEDLSRARLPSEESLQDIESKVTRLSMFATYALRKNADLRFDLIHERWRTNDWTWSFADGDTFEYNEGGNATTVAVKPREIANFIGARYIYKFQ